MMNKALSKNHTYYFVRYPVGGAGAHLSNLITLDPTFSPKILDKNKDDYINFLFKEYSLPWTDHKNAHLSAGHLIISNPQWHNFLEKINYTMYSNSVHLTHAAGIYWQNIKLQTLQNKKFILIKFSTKRSLEIVKQREKLLFNTDTFTNIYYTEEIRHFYNQWIEVPGEIADDLNLEIEVEELFCTNITNIINKINNKFDLNIPLKESQSLHKLWFDKVSVE